MGSRLRAIRWGIRQFVTLALVTYAAVATGFIYDLLRVYPDGPTIDSMFSFALAVVIWGTLFYVGPLLLIWLPGTTAFLLVLGLQWRRWPAPSRRSTRAIVAAIVIGLPPALGFAVFRWDLFATAALILVPAIFGALISLPSPIPRSSVISVIGEGST